jgi:hypothetical protein
MNEPRKSRSFLIEDINEDISLHVLSIARVFNNGNPWGLELKDLECEIGRFSAGNSVQQSLSRSEGFSAERHGRDVRLSASAYVSVQNPNSHFELTAFPAKDVPISLSYHNDFYRCPLRLN